MAICRVCGIEIPSLSDTESGFCARHYASQYTINKGARKVAPENEGESLTTQQEKKAGKRRGGRPDPKFQPTPTSGKRRLI
jgi:hypothetical protein